MTLSDEDDNYFKDGADVEVGTEETFRDSQFVGLVWSQLGLILFITSCLGGFFGKSTQLSCIWQCFSRWHIQNRQLHKWNSFGGSVQFLDSLTVQAVQIRAVEVCVCASLAAVARYRGRYIREGDVCVHIVQWQGTLRRMHSDPDQPDLAPHLWDKMSKSLTSSKWGRRPEQQQVMEK